MQVTIAIFARFHPNIEGETMGVARGLPTSHPLPPTIIEGLAARWLFRVPPAAKALYIYKHPCPRRDSNPVSTSASITTISVGRRIVN
ncbi:hypothetical protein TNCV_2395831 [Trichonephila clavipes]|nr:hypothetical protein TNCV_2395831 [Trichonephila clavipes]